MAPFYAGLIATLPPWVSPLNQQLKGIIGTERSVINAAQLAAGVMASAAPYSLAEIGQLQAGRVSLIAKPSPGGNYTGVNAAVNSSSNPTAAPSEYSTMTNFLAKTFATKLGSWISQNQSTRPNDLVRAGVRKDFNTFLQGLADKLAIDSFSVQCDLGNNSAASIAAHFLYVNSLVRYMASIWYFLVSFTGGTTVVVTVQSGGNS
jgi:phage tail sheath protein FI